MGDKPYFYSCYFSFAFESMNLVTSATTPLYLYFIGFVVPSKVLVEFGARFRFLRRNRFFVSTVKIAIIFLKNWIDLKLFVRDPQMYTQLSLLQSFSIWATEVPRNNSSLRTVLFWQILPFLLRSLFYFFLCGFLCSESFSSCS